MSEKKKANACKNLYEKRLEAIYTISSAITSDLYLEDILKLIVSVTAQALNSKISSLMLLNEKGELELKATQSVSEAYNKKPNIKVGEGIAGKVALENKPIAVKDVKKDSRYVNREIAKKEKLCSLLCLPLSVKGKVIGVLNEYTSLPHEFTQQEIEILKAIANQAAIVIENARLLVQSRVIKEELESRKLIERAKGVLMKEDNLNEEEAFQKIQKFSMNSRKPMKEIAEAILIHYDLKNKSR